MQSHRCHAAGIFGLTLVLAITTPAFAKNARTIHLNFDAFLNGKELKEGAYKVQWESHSPQVTVTFSQGKSTVVTAAGHWINRDVTYPSNSIVYDTNPDGTRTIIEIQLAGSKQVIVFGESDSPAEPSPPSSMNSAPGGSGPRAQAAATSRIRFVGKPAARRRNPDSFGQASAPGILPLGHFYSPILLAPPRTPRPWL